MPAIIGRKVGMTQIFGEDGARVPLTVIEAGPCHVTQVKTKDTDGYDAVQLGFGTTKPKSLTKPELGHLKKASAPPVRHLVEFSPEELGAEVAVGADPGDIAAQLGPRVAQIGWIITDFNLGDGPDGITRVDRITSSAPDARVLVLSGEMNRHAAAAASKAGFEVMDKPARPDKIVAWLERA